MRMEVRKGEEREKTRKRERYEDEDGIEEMDMKMKLGEEKRKRMNKQVRKVKTKKLDPTCEIFQFEEIINASEVYPRICSI